MKERWLIEVPDPAYHYALFSPDGSYTLVDDPNNATRFRGDFKKDEALDGAKQLILVRADHPQAFCSRHYWPEEP